MIILSLHLLPGGHWAALSDTPSIGSSAPSRTEALHSIMEALFRTEPSHSGSGTHDIFRLPNPGHHSFQYGGDSVPPYGEPPETV